MTRINRSTKSRKIARETYSYACCAICGLTLEAALDVAHLNQIPSDDTPDNLAHLCKTHHRMFDCGLYPVEGLKLFRDHWQEWHANGAKADHSLYMKDAGVKAARKRRRRAAGIKAQQTMKEIKAKAEDQEKI